MAIELYWLEQTAGNVPMGEKWLAAGEIAHLQTLRVPKRRADWLLGRWAAKCAVATFLQVPVENRWLAEIEIRPQPSGAPQVFLACEPAPVSLSLSHTAGSAMCAVALPGTAIGCDIEIIEARGQAFISDYFTTEEQAAIARASAADQAMMATVLWSAKESALKALHEGLRLDTRSVAVVVKERPHSGDAWSRLQVRCAGGQIFRGWWHYTGDLVRTLVSWPESLVPTPLHISMPVRIIG